MRNDKTKILAAGLLVACAVTQAMRPAMAAHAAIHYWPLVKDAKAGNKQAAQRVLQAARNSAELGFPANAGIEYYAGLLYDNGWGVSRNQYEAAYWYKKAAEQGEAAAENNLGVDYQLGDGIPQNHAKAIYWFQKAATQGYVLARHNLAALKKKETSQEVTRTVVHYGPLAKEARVGFDDAQAVHKILQGALTGNTAAEFYAGVLYYHGWSVSKNNAKAVYWWRKAAKQGSASAENNLGVAYQHGYGVPQDYTKAVYWYRKAAAQGYAAAEYDLGQTYFFARGVPQDYAKAVYWWRKAAKQGSASAENNLGVAYQHGYGVPQDYTKAVYWDRKAAAQGNFYAGVNLADLRKDTGHSAGNAGTPARRSDSMERFTTYCNNASCVRRYSNGTSVHFTACINPADGQPMLNAPIRNGVGSCSGTDSDGNLYGTGSFQ
jgi:hypothetical protein